MAFTPVPQQNPDDRNSFVNKFYVPEQQNLPLFFEAKNYRITINDWLSEAWHIYKLNWPVYLTIAVLIGLVYNIPYVGFLLVIPIETGYYYMIFNYLRPYHSQEEGQLVFNNKLDVNDIFKGISRFAAPTIIIFVLYTIGVALGLICLIIPGIYLAIVWGEVIPLYIEFSDYPFAFNSYTDYFTICRRHLHKNFWGVLAAYIVIPLFAISGFLLLFVGLLVTVPVALIMQALMFRDIFGLRAHSNIPYNPYSYANGPLAPVAPVTPVAMAYVPTVQDVDPNTAAMYRQSLYPQVNVVQYGSGVPVSSIAYPTMVIPPNQMPPQ